MDQRLIDAIKIEYFDEDEWKFYKGGALLATNMLPETKADEELKINLEHFTASSVKIWFPANAAHTAWNEGYIGGRFDLMILPPE